LPVEQVEKLILERGLTLTGFRVHAGTGSRCVDYFLSGTSDGEHRDFIMGCYFEREAKIPAPWNPFIEEILSERSSVGAWQHNNFITRGKLLIDWTAFTSRDGESCPPAIKLGQSHLQDQFPNRTSP